MSALMDFFAVNEHPSAIGWYALFGMEGHFPIPLVMFIAFIAFVSIVLIPLSFGLGFVERKLSADLQARVGPNRTALSGALQMFADFVKLGTKRKPDRSTKFTDLAWPGIRSAALYSTVALIPFGTTLIFFDSDFGSFLSFLCFGIYSLGGLFANEDAEDLEDSITAQRQVFLWISAWTPAILSLMIAVIPAGGSRWSAILQMQDGGIFRWLALSSPFGFVGFFVFTFSGLVALQLPPFHTIDRGLRHRKGEQLALSGINDFYALFTWCLFSSALFLGGADRPHGMEPGFLLSVIELSTLTLKASLILILLRVVAKALPQIRQDQMTEFCWRILAPIAAICVVGQVGWSVLFSPSAGGTP